MYNNNIKIKVVKIIIFGLFCAGFISCEKSGTGSNQNNDLKPKMIIQLSIPEPSGLTYNNTTGNLYTVTDGDFGKIYETTTSGKLVRTIYTSCKDMEGIAINSSNDTLFIVEEEKCNIVKYTLQGQLTGKILVPVTREGQNGLEGIAIHPTMKHIFIVNEKRPRILLELTPTGKVVTLTKISFADDLSGLCFVPGTDHLLLVSHESHSLFEIDLSGKMLRSWKIPVEQAEGVAIDQNGQVYIVCDKTSQLYIFDLN
jgi:uncharacterized protein YjiK